MYRIGVDGTHIWDLESRGLRETAVEDATKASATCGRQYTVWDMRERPPRRIGHAFKGQWYWDASFTGAHGRNAYTESCDRNQTPPETPRMWLQEHQQRPISEAEMEAIRPRKRPPAQRFAYVDLRINGVPFKEEPILDDPLKVQAVEAIKEEMREVLSNYVGRQNTLEVRRTLYGQMQKLFISGKVTF